MATLVLSAAGMALGNAVGGTVLGLSSALVGRFVGASIGRSIDTRLMGGSQAVETGRVDRFRLTGASEGTAIARVYGRMRTGGQVIWSSHFEETKTTSGGGKGSPKPKVTSFSYSVNLAIALCEGPISGVGRIWADGVEIARDELTMRVYTGTPDQMPDPKMEAIEGAGEVPAYRGTAYVVFEDLALAPFGNRVPSFSFEVLSGGNQDADLPDVADAVQAIALMPGTGEYALATQAAYVDKPEGTVAVNVNSPSGKADLPTSIDTLGAEVPGCKATSLIVSWFGDDLRCGSCRVEPLVEPNGADAQDPVGFRLTGGGNFEILDRLRWRIGDHVRGDAKAVPVDTQGRAVYGGTPADFAVREAITYLRDSGQEVLFYPFVLMTQMAGNTLADPYSDAQSQPALPWRGRITASKALGQDGSPIGTAQTRAEVDAFFGQAQVSDFGEADGEIVYSGPDEWSYRRFILHYAKLCQMAGGVDAFCVGTEMRGLTWLRDDQGFPAVDQFIALARDVRALLGPDTKISYAADWSEYWGYQPQDGSNDRLFHLDPFWADDNVDFVAIDNYFPSADWRDGTDHADAHWGSIYNPDYLQANIEGGEGYDWFYHSPEARAAQIRTPITDGAYGEPWVYRFKDVRGFWENLHHDRIGGVRSERPTAWVPMSKPIWFTEIGCAAVDKGANQPNKFLDAKSSENALPHFSNGGRDELMQMQYLRAHLSYWSAPDNNPMSDLYDGRMLDMAHAYVWAWDARPYPHFPANRDLWTDGVNYDRGHWINGRSSARALASVIKQIAANAGVQDVDTTSLYGYVRGYLDDGAETARAALQPLLTAYGVDALDQDGVLRFRMRDGISTGQVARGDFAVSDGLSRGVASTRAPQAEMASRVRLTYVEADGDYAVRSLEAALPNQDNTAVAGSEVSLALTDGEAQLIAERWLAEAQVARDTVRAALPPSMAGVRAGDTLTLDVDGATGDYRVDTIETSDRLEVEATRVEAGVYEGADLLEPSVSLAPFVPPVPFTGILMDLPLLRGDEVPTNPYLAAYARPWSGGAAVYSSVTQDDFTLRTVAETPARIGALEVDLPKGQCALIDRVATMEISLRNGVLASIERAQLLAGGNTLALGRADAGGWEIIQFETAELIGPRRYRLSGLVRGQAGTDAIMPDVWDAGTPLVILDGAVQQFDLAPNLRDVAVNYLIGPDGRPFSDAAYRAQSFTTTGVGLRPYAPCHLRAEDAGSDWAIRWIRRTRKDGDSWAGLDVPLSEDREAYVVRLMDGAQIVAEYSATQPWITVPKPAKAGQVAVAQISDQFGYGPFQTIDLPA
ncbi:glycoside hydrolase/phage tail family protein [Nereida sp. MMG025]|uniref:baseplate multidomain protein megatron n=1 Tax=Nereida sp. MMG025 TaxID=2909981 RepID=UPI001F21445B|nr:glycoside hydrolase/phage tail family protein [Nereida sp. MMG025]MCF6443479.1 glycoside hydrolase/phage tail family protein [Nereida sp. MMG025]